MGRGFLLAVAAAVSGLAAAPGWVQDADGDGMADGIEQVLGCDPQVADQFELILDDKSRADGDEGLPADNYSAERDITQVRVAPAGGNRFVWRVDFAADYARENSILILYLDADNDDTTGRKDNRGVDYMMWAVSGSARCSFIDEGGEYHPYRMPAIAYDGPRLYVSNDLDLHQEGGKSVYRLSVLSETEQPHQGVDNTGLATVSAAPPADRPKIAMDQDIAESQNIQLCADLLLIDRLKEDAEQVRLPIEGCALEGFRMDHSEYRDNNALNPPAGGTITATVPRGGTWHPAFIFYDAGGDERMSVEINGERKGFLVAGRDNNRQYLCCLTEPVALKEGDTLVLRALGAGPHRTEDLLLLKEPPPAWAPKHDLQWVGTHRPWDSDGTTVHVCWTTNWRTECMLHYGLTEDYGQQVAESMALNNHRLVLRGLEPNEEYHAMVEATQPDGAVLKTMDFTFRTVPPEPPEGRATRAQVPLSIVARKQLPARTWPITMGVPLAKGQLGDPGHVRLVDDDGQETPCQVAVTNRWADGSIKWLLLDFPAEVAGDADPGTPASPQPQARYVLEYGSEVRRGKIETALAVAETDEAITITTGPARFEVSKKQFGLIGRAWLDRDGDEEFTDQELVLDSRGSPDPPAGPLGEVGAPAEVFVEEDGPERVCVRVAGAQGGPLTHGLRLHFYAGQSFFRAMYDFAVHDTSETFTDVQATGIGLSAASPGQRVRTVEAPEGADVRHAIEQRTADLAWSGTPFTREFGEPREGRAEGWIALDTERAALGVALRNFWQLYPKGLVATAEGLFVGICPPLQKELYQSDGPEDYRLYYYLKDGVYKLRHGVSKSHELLICLGEPGMDMAGYFRYLQDPPVAAAPPEHYCATEAFNTLASANQQVYPTYDELLRKAMDDYLKRREDNREYGWMNFGDWWGERAINWGNIEYDTQHAFALQWARSGDLDFFFAGQEADRHHRDVDTVRYHPNEAYVGRVYAHCIGHVGNYYAKSPVEGKGSVAGGFTVSHTWSEGFCDWYHLTGDRRDLETALLVTDTYDSYGTCNYDFTNCRNPGWHLILTMATHNATNDPYYLNAARIIVERAIERQRADGSWRRHMVPGHCHCTPRHHGNAGFMVAVLLNGLKLYHQATEDERIPEVMRRAARWMIDDMWAEEKAGFRYTSCPKSSAGPWCNFMFFDGALYAARLTGDDVIPQYARKGMEAAMEGGVSGFGKSLSMSTRVLPHLIWEMEQLGE